MSTITVAKALAELKILDKRIPELTANFSGCGSVIGKKLPPNFETREDLEKFIKSQYDKIVALMKRRRDIKSAIMVSNASTDVTVGKVTMTVAEAIVRKHTIETDRELVKVMKERLAFMQGNIDKQMEQVKARLDDLIKVTFGADAKVSEHDYDNVARPFMRDNEPKLVDPIKIQEKIKEWEDNISDFEMNVDAALTEINVRTDIELDD